MRVADFVSENGELMDVAELLQVRTKILLLKCLRHLANEQFDCVGVLIRSRRLHRAARVKVLRLHLMRHVTGVRDKLLNTLCTDTHNTRTTQQTRPGTRNGLARLFTLTPSYPSVRQGRRNTAARSAVNTIKGEASAQQTIVEARLVPRHIAGDEVLRLRWSGNETQSKSLYHLNPFNPRLVSQGKEK